MNNRKITVWFVAFACAAMASIASLIAQTNGVPVPPAPTAGAFGGPQFYVDLATPILTILLAAFAVRVKPQMGLPLQAAIVVTLGTISSALATVVLGTGIQSTGTVVKAAALALAGVAVKVLADKLGEKPAT